MNKRQTQIPMNTLKMSQPRIKVIASYTATPCLEPRIEQATGWKDRSTFQMHATKLAQKNIATIMMICGID